MHGLSFTPCGASMGGWVKVVVPLGVVDVAPSEGLTLDVGAVGVVDVGTTLVLAGAVVLVEGALEVGGDVTLVPPGVRLAVFAAGPAAF